jgi:uncharacterized RDD family membrane protein YckC
MFKAIKGLFRRKREPRKIFFEPFGAERQELLRGVELAPFGRRAFAFAMDFTFVSLCLLPFLIPEALERMDKTGVLAINIDPFHGWEVISLPLYFGLWTYFGKGQTLGKKLMRIRVVSLTHSHLGFWHSIERSLGYGASILEGGFGFFQFFIYPNRQTLHDRIAETIVVKVEKPPAPRKSDKKTGQESTGPGQN